MPKPKPKPKKEKDKDKSRRVTFFMHKDIARLWDGLLALGYVSNADLLRDMIREYAKIKGVK